MRKLFMAALLIACAAPFTFAQTASGGDYNKYDIYGGFSHDRVDIGGGSGREGFNGVEGAITGNLSRYFGLKGDYSFHQGNELSMANLKTHYGDAFSKPLHKCLVLQNQKFGLLPSE